MGVENHQIIIYFITFSIPLLLQWYKLQHESDKEQKPFEWKQIFSSSLRIIIASIGFIYALVEKDNKFQFLYYIVILLLFLGLIFERFKGNKQVVANISLMAFTIFLPSYFLFVNPNSEEPTQSVILADNDLQYLEEQSNNAISLKSICSDFLSDIKPINEVEFSSLIKKLNQNDIDKEEKDLFMACLLLQKKKFPVVEEYLKKINSERFTTDVNFIKFKINKSNYDLISELELNENLSYLEIDKDKIIEAKNYINESYKKGLKILILDASGGRYRKTTIRGEALKNKFKEYTNSKVEAYDYINTEPNIKLHISGFYTKADTKKGINELKQKLRRSGYREFNVPGNYISTMADTYDLVIITSK